MIKCSCSNKPFHSDLHLKSKSRRIVFMVFIFVVLFISFIGRSVYGSIEKNSKINECINKRRSLISGVGSLYKEISDMANDHKIGEQERSLIYLCQGENWQKNDDADFVSVIFHEVIHFAGMIGRSIDAGLSRNDLAKKDGYYTYVMADNGKVVLRKVMFENGESLKNVVKNILQKNKISKREIYEHNNLFGLLDEWNAYLQQLALEIKLLGSGHLQHKKNKRFDSLISVFEMKYLACEYLKTQSYRKKGNVIEKSFHEIVSVDVFVRELSEKSDFFRIKAESTKDFQDASYIISDAGRICSGQF